MKEFLMNVLIMSTFVLFSTVCLGVVLIFTASFISMSTSPLYWAASQISWLGFRVLIVGALFVGFLLGNAD